MDHAPTSFVAWKGPPGWPRSTSRCPSRMRWRRIPALTRSAMARFSQILGDTPPGLSSERAPSAPAALRVHRGASRVDSARAADRADGELRQGRLRELARPDSQHEGGDREYHVARTRRVA